MSSESMYCGSAKEIQASNGNTGLNVEIDLTQLGQHLRGDAAEFVRTWTDRDGVEHKCIKLSVWPMKEPTEYRTHSVKVNTYKAQPRPEQSQPEPQQATFDNGVVEDAQGEMPF